MFNHLLLMLCLSHGTAEFPMLQSRIQKIESFMWFWSFRGPGIAPIASPSDSAQFAYTTGLEALMAKPLSGNTNFQSSKHQINIYVKPCFIPAKRPINILDP